MRRIPIPGGLALALCLLALPATAQQRFFHIEIEAQEDGEQVSINLPLGLVQKGIDLAPDSVRWRSHVHLAGGHFEWEDLRELRDVAQRLGSDGNTTVRIDRRQVQVTRQGNEVRIMVPARRWRADDVETTVPYAVLDALVSGQRYELDLAAALEALARHERGWTLRVEDRDGSTRARMWVDDSAGQG